jgi:hypothetical protein
MYTYTHYALARKLAPRLAPDQLGDYLWGAIAPDVRYLTGLRRQQTHLPREAIQAWFEDYPQFHSFVLGYQVHCLLDEIDLALVLERGFPFNLVKLVRRKSFSQQQMGALVELHSLQAPLPPEPVSGEHNPILDSLGVRPEDSTAFTAALCDYLAAPSLLTGLRSFEQTGLLTDTRIERYIRATQALERHRVMKSILLLGVKNSHVEQKAIDYVSRHTVQPGSHLPGETG